MVDYKTGRRPPGTDDARGSQALALYVLGIAGAFAAALLLRHEFGVIDRGINLFEALAHIPLEAGGQIYILEGITDAGGAGLERRTVAGEGSHLIRAHAGLSGLALFALGLQAHVAAVVLERGLQLARLVVRARDVVQVQAAGLDVVRLAQLLGRLLISPGGLVDGGLEHAEKLIV